MRAWMVWHAVFAMPRRGANIKDRIRVDIGDGRIERGGFLEIGNEFAEAAGGGCR